MNKLNIVILGGGISGVGAAILAASHGERVFLSENKNLSETNIKVLQKYSVDYEEGTHSTEKILQADLIVKSPGIPENSAIMKLIRSQSIKVVSEIEYASWYTEAPVIAITGSNGKTTTTLLLHHILQCAGVNAGLAGNVGNSFAKMVATEKHDCYVLEISSFQLDDCEKFSPHVAVILNITPDHLDRYESKMEKYVNSKFRITSNLTQDDYFIYSSDDDEIQKYLQNNEVGGTHCPFSLKMFESDICGYIQDNSMIIKTKQNTFTMNIEKLALQGKHNLYDSMAASIAARLLDIRSKFLQQSLSDFVNVEHRLEFVAQVHGVTFINDSKATNVNSTWYALECINTPIVWIAGGQDKGNNYSSLFELVQKKVKALVCLGKNNTEIVKTFTGIIPTIVETESALDAVQASYRLSSSGDTVLLSPACASFDLFENYEDRGSQFKLSVRNL